MQGECPWSVEMDYKGVRYQTEKFIYRAPLDASAPAVSTMEPSRKETWSAILWMILTK